MIKMIIKVIWNSYDHIQILSRYIEKQSYDMNQERRTQNNIIGCMARLNLNKSVNFEFDKFDN